MIVWTAVLYRMLLRLLGPGVEFPFLNMTAAATFAYSDIFFRTGEPYTTALFRAIGLQMLIFLLCYLPKIIASPFLGWLSVKMAYYKWRNRRAEKKKAQKKSSGPWGGK